MNHFSHFELYNGMFRVSIRMVFDKKCPGFFMAIGSNEPSYKRSLLLVKYRSGFHLVASYVDFLGRNK